MKVSGEKFPSVLFPTFMSRHRFLPKGAGMLWCAGQHDLLALDACI